MKKTFGLILSLLIGTALLAACGSTAKSNFGLQISMEGVVDIPGFVKGTFGPDTAWIPLEPKQVTETYMGSYSGEFHAKMTEGCNVNVKYPVTFNVTAKGTKELDISVNTSIAMGEVYVCPDVSGSYNKPPTKGVITFTLPAVNGASYVWNAPKSEYGSLTWTFTLKKQ